VDPGRGNSAEAVRAQIVSLDDGTGERWRAACFARYCAGRLQSEIRFARKRLAGGYARTAIAQYLKRKN